MAEDESSSVIYDSDEEGAQNYKEGGYHIVELNDVFLDRYIVVQKLGWGHFSTVWLCKDTKYNTYVAMKIQKSATHYTEAAYDEIDILMQVSNKVEDPRWLGALEKNLSPSEYDEVKTAGAARNYCYVVQLLNSFVHFGPNGKHVCMVFEVLGVNLLEVIKHYNYRGVPLPIVRAIARQVLIGLDYLHRICSIIHTDLKPENVLVQLTQAQINDVLAHGKITNLPLKPVETWTELTERNFATSAEREAFLKKEKKKLKKKRYRERKKKKQLEATTAAPALPEPQAIEVPKPVEVKAAPEEVKEVAEGDATKPQENGIGKKKRKNRKRVRRKKNKQKAEDALQQEAELLQEQRQDEEERQVEEERLEEEARLEEDARIEEEERLEEEARLEVEARLEEEERLEELTRLQEGSLEEEERLEENQYSDEQNEEPPQDLYDRADPYDIDDEVDRELAIDYNQLTRPSDRFDNSDYERERLEDWEDDPNAERSQPLSASELAGDDPERLNGPVMKSVVQHLPPIDENIKIKIADLGNACWFDHHFSSEIQTRQYRSPEVMLGVSYNASADMWSFACMIFELCTGDFMFEPKGGPEFSKEDDHLAQMIEALGKMPKSFALSGSQSKKFFDSNGRLRKVEQLKFWPLRDVLMEKYGFKQSEAKALSDFLLPMLAYQPEKRASAEECLKHYWLDMPSNYDTRMNESEYAALMEQLELKQAEVKVRVMRGEHLSSPESAREGSPWDASVEDNYDRTDSDSEKGVEEQPVFEEVTEYHERMAKIRALLIS
eukprot:CAMPEP_0204899314 /NCGR_PEP_ID=MMETSP1397-20131031/1785_1 /ASSEMBLY_ACC=CAM_ASM_000891 /TAXON_ID=49980 /ORGANISM="Climacostomum Climacostomum virens, Strain Stock W-24" /LENGTH=779 /DNA_ID=CAMNT_0052067263 /DNA_START=31 /DNA_END=2370 /DNA_ORIENTATION=+